MSTQAGVFVLQGDQSLVSMQPARFASEADFQGLLARFPELLVGDQIDPEDPRRWVLVKREQAVGLDQADGARWSIDHVFLDQDGIPTLVEIKRQTDSRIRREVVGQMLDYAANCAAFWSTGALRSSFEQTCATAGRQSDDVLAELVGADFEADAFWARVEKNLADGQIRLLFVADVIPIELRRIVDFLNRQMSPAEVLAIELRQFEGQGIKTIVPMVFGQSETAAAQRSASAPRTVWNESRFMEKLGENRPQAETRSARNIFEVMRGSGGLIGFGSGLNTGSAHAVFKVDGLSLKPAYLYTDGRLEMNFGNLKGKPIFDGVEARQKLMDKFTSIEGVTPSSWKVDGFPNMSLAMIAADPEGDTKIRSAFNWFGRVVRGEITPDEN